MSSKVLFMDGEFIDSERGVISVRTHAFAYGTACFEGIRGYWNEKDQQVYLFRLREHYERLLNSCRVLHFSLPYTVEQLVDISIELVRRNDQHQDVYLRPVAYISDPVIGVKLHDMHYGFLLTSEPMGNYVDLAGLKCGVSSWRRVDDNAIPARAKICGAYVNSAFAKSEALMNGFDEAIMLTNEGHVSEGSAENIFLMINGELVTPAASENILLGITRDTVIQLAQRELNMITKERQIDRTELYSADEVFLCGTGAQIAQVVEIDHRRIGGRKFSRIGEYLQDTYFDIVRGKRMEYREGWCQPVFARVTASHAAEKAE